MPKRKCLTCSGFGCPGYACINSAGLSDLVSISEISKAVNPVCLKLSRMGYGKPEFRTTRSGSVIPVDADAKGITWCGSNRDFDCKALGSMVSRGDSVRLYFHDDSGCLAGDITLDTATMTVSVEDDCGNKFKI